MRQKRKMLMDLIFLLAVFGLTLYGIFHGKDLPGMLAAIKQANLWYLLPGFFCVLLFIWGESIIIWYMMRSFHIRVKKWTCFLFSSVGFFFSCITPSASGGQPMQLYYMKKEALSMPVSTVILMMVTIIYKFVLVVIGVGIILLGQGFLHHFLEGILPIYYLGIVLNIVCVGNMLMLVFHPLLARKIMQQGTLLLEKLHILKHKENRMQKLETSMHLFCAAASNLRRHMLVIVNVFIMTFFQRMALFITTYFVYRAFALTGFTVIEIVLLQAVISVTVDMLPLPGGMGISEGLFLILFQPVFGPVLLPAMILCRGLGYYAQLLISAIFTGAAQLTLGKSYNKAKINQIV